MGWMFVVACEANGDTQVIICFLCVYIPSEIIRNVGCKIQRTFARTFRNSDYVDCVGVNLH